MDHPIPLFANIAKMHMNDIKPMNINIWKLSYLFSIMCDTSKAKKKHRKPENKKKKKKKYLIYLGQVTQARTLSF